MTHRRLPRKVVDSAVKHLRRVDPVMNRLIRAVGPCEMKVERDRFRSLVRAIVAQQISTAAARSILAKLEASLADGRLTVDNLLAVPRPKLRSAGLSERKVEYLTDLAGHVRDGRLPLANLGRYPDQKVIDLLTDIRGIGVWTAQMFLMFSLGRPDVFAPDDLGLRAAIGNLYGFAERPGKHECLEVAAAWSPFASIASWYLWRSFEPEIQAEWNET